MPTHESFVHPFRLPHRGEERAHFNFCCTFAQQKTERPRGVVLSLSESLTEFRVRRRERCLIRFLPRPVRGRKHFARSERRIGRIMRPTEAQSAARLSQKSGFAAFLKLLHHAKLEEIVSPHRIVRGLDVDAVAGVFRRQRAGRVVEDGIAVDVEDRFVVGELLELGVACVDG